MVSSWKQCPKTTNQYNETPVCYPGVHKQVGQLCLTAPAENCGGHGAVLIWDQTENPFPQEFNQGQTSD